MPAAQRRAGMPGRTGVGGVRDTAVATGSEARVVVVGYYRRSVAPNHALALCHMGICTVRRDDISIGATVIEGVQKRVWDTSNGTASGSRVAARSPATLHHHVRSMQIHLLVQVECVYI